MRLRTLLVFAACLLDSCGGSADKGGIGPTITTVKSVTVSISAASIAVGDSLHAIASVRDANGAVMSGRSVTWASSNNAIAAVSTSGSVIGIAPGTATISATSDGTTGSATLSVVAPTPAPVAGVDILLASSLLVGQVVQATVVLTDVVGNELSGRTVTWSTSNPSVATVSATGLVTTVAAGFTSITATSEGQTKSFALVVIRPTAPVAAVAVTLAPSATAGQAFQASVTLTDSAGQLLTGRAIAWSSSNPAVAAVSATGLVTTASAGAATITASSEGKSGSATITVSPAVVPVASVSVALASSSLTVGGTTQATATTRDASGNVLAGRAVSWTSAGTASVDARGLVSGLAVGTATITASSEGKSAAAQVTVAPRSQGDLSISYDLSATPYALAGATITGPNGFHVDTSVASDTAVLLKNLAPGDYTVTSIAFWDGPISNNMWYAPPSSEQIQTVTVSAGQLSKTSFTYQLISGELNLVVSGLVARAAVCVLWFETPQITHRTGYGISPTNNGSNVSRAPGYGPSQLRCDAHIANGISYEPVPIQQSVSIPEPTPSASNPGTASVAYAPAASPGTLSLSVTGVIGLDARVEISGPRFALVEVLVPPNRPLDLTGLSPGTYKIRPIRTSGLVNGNVVAFDPTPPLAYQFVTITSGAITTASCAYK